MTTDYAQEHKVPPFDLIEMTNRDPRFYPTVGPLLSRREVVGELGGPMWDDDDKDWIIAVGTDGVYGVIARRRGTVVSLYVVLGQRGRFVGTTMLLRLILRAGGGKLRAIATPASLGLFAECGFKPVTKRGRYTVLERSV